MKFPDFLWSHYMKGILDYSECFNLGRLVSIYVCQLPDKKAHDFLIANPRARMLFEFWY